jgi:Mg/Co/Ni transporter MgtE
MSTAFLVGVWVGAVLAVLVVLGIAAWLMRDMP